MTRRPQIAWLAQGKRLHLQDGPIDLVIEANGSATNIGVALEAAIYRFTGLLDTLCDELPELRRPVAPDSCTLRGDVARHMFDATAPFAAKHFITPMAAVAGAVADDVLGAMTASANLDRAYVNNGGDIALHLANGARFEIGIVDRPHRPGLIGKMVIAASHPVRGVATSGWHGRSFSLGIADAVTVLARTAAQADAAATIIANAVDLPGNPLIVRRPAREIQPDSDLGRRLVTCNVGKLSSAEIAMAIEAGVRQAHDLLASGLIEGAAIHLQGKTVAVGPTAIRDFAPRSPLGATDQRRIESLMYA